MYATPQRSSPAPQALRLRLMTQYCSAEPAAEETNARECMYAIHATESKPCFYPLIHVLVGLIRREREIRGFASLFFLQWRPLIGR